MRYPSAFIDELRDRLKLSAVVSEFVLWDKRKTRSGKGDYWACCPFHSEKSPSFHVDDRRGSYHCFGCGVTGDHFRFLMERQGKSFPEAVEWVASRAGMPLPELTPEMRQTAARRLTLVEANAKAAEWFKAQLWASPTALDYAASRGLTNEELGRFGIGYAPAGNALTRAHIGNDDELVAAGVLGRSDTGGRIYDRFADRLMFPIADAKGRTIGFAGRDLSGKADAKYLNTAETEVFDKGAVLYNFAAAKEAAWNGAGVIAVEGQIDVIAATRTGLAAVAPMGTALTDAHVALLAKMAEEPVLCFDGDAAGRKAAQRAIDLILPVTGPAFTARFASLPDGDDVDSLVRRSPQQLLRTVQTAKPLADALWHRETFGRDASSPEDKARITASIRAQLTKIKDQDTRRAYGQDFKERLTTLGRRPGLYRSNSYSQHSTSPGANRLVAGFHANAGLSLKEAILIGAIAMAPDAALDNAEALAMDSRLSPAAVALIGQLVTALSAAPEKAVQEVLLNAGLADAVGSATAQASAAGVSLDMATAAQLLTTARRH